MAQRVAESLKKVNLSKKRAAELETRRLAWGEPTLVNEIVSKAYEDWIEVTGSALGVSHYLTYVLDIEGLLLSNEMLNNMAQAQKNLDTEVIEEFFEKVPEDSVMGLLTQELVASLDAGAPVRVYEP